MTTWKIAAVQMDCKLADPRHNLAVMRTRLREAAPLGQLVGSTTRSAPSSIRQRVDSGKLPS